MECFSRRSAERKTPVLAMQLINVSVAENLSWPAMCDGVPIFLRNEVRFVYDWEIWRLVLQRRTEKIVRPLLRAGHIPAF